ncbi:hypothetical protein MtrunA17_Chr5g0424641 [Medicago truncatula]|uniref:Uncharacterized protein n=1 Tax=Medicago truncatula TaxID=3880 RepID=G7K9V9_MEDTR|nr:hypothetical protein MTR_5g060340 [Medicago truncatula]RHN56004.1 hypothetical protein MtrunA17_Chr5g0424641 [Medicago truncatula]
MALVGEKKKKKHGQYTENGMVITVYVESSRARSSNKSSKKTKPQYESKTRRGCDRKAQLLAYSLLSHLQLCCKLLYCGKKQANVVDAAAIAVIVLLWRRLKLLLYCNHICSYIS